MTAPVSMPRAVIAARNRKANLAAARQIRELSHALDSMSRALEDDDHILGPLASEAVANCFAALPKHIRDAFIEQLDDEAARSLRADQLYLSELFTQEGVRSEAHAPTTPKKGTVN